MDEAPIEELPFKAGASVVDIGDIRVARGMARRSHSACRHRRLAYDTRERRIWCQDCESTVEAFDAFSIIVSQHADASAKLSARAQSVAEAELHAVRSRAAKAIDKAWGHRSMVPACPHCQNGLFPEYFAGERFSMLGKDYARARIQKPDNAR